MKTQKNLTKLISVLMAGDILAITVFCIAIFAFLFFSGTITSGYHFIDDHGIVSLRGTLDNSGFFEALIGYIKNDFLIRFRPVFSIYTVTISKIFGTNFLQLSVFVGLLCSVVFSLFYLFFRKLGNDRLLSVLFVALSFIGFQSAIWWRLGTNETISVFFLGLALYSLARGLNKSNKLSNILFLTFLIIASLSKESFIVIIPAVIALKIILEKNHFGISFKDTLLRNKLAIIPLIVMFAEIVLIKFVVGTNQIGYAGVPSSSSEFLRGLKNIIIGKNSLLIYNEFLVVLFLAFLFSNLQKIKDKSCKIFEDILPYLTFFVLVLIPELLMHAKSGLVERYLLPTTIAYAFLYVGLIKNTKDKKFKSISIILATVFVIYSYLGALNAARVFTDSGKDANLLLKGVIGNTNPNSKILIAVDPVQRFEVSYSLKIYLNHKDRKNIYAFPILGVYDTDFEKKLKSDWENWFKGKYLAEISGVPDVILLFDADQETIFFEKSGINKNIYRNIDVGGYPHRVYVLPSSD